MASTLTAYGASTSITITLAALATSTTAGRSSLVVDNSTNLYLDALVQVTLAISTGTLTDSVVDVYCYGTADGGTSYNDQVAGTDSAYTLNSATANNLVFLGQIQTPVVSKTYISGPMSVASAFGGVLPQKWGIVVVNHSGIALASGSAKYQGVSSTTA